VFIEIVLCTIYPNFKIFPISQIIPSQFIELWLTLSDSWAVFPYMDILFDMVLIIRFSLVFHSILQ
jgi:hypothetical protein